MVLAKQEKKYDEFVNKVIATLPRIDRKLGRVNKIYTTGIKL